MTDPVRKSIKVFDPSTDTLKRYRLEGFGQPSSCRIRVENNRAFIYITELAAPNKEKGRRYNGRGVLRLPLDAFEK